MGLTNSDRLRERLLGETVEVLTPWVEPLTDPYQPALVLMECLMPLIEAEINKLNAEKAETIEVLEELQTLNWYLSSAGVARWRRERAEPLLDKLKGES